MPDTIEKLRELLADGYWIQKKTTPIFATPNPTPEVTLVLKKGEEDVQMVFHGKDAVIAETIFNNQR